MTSLFVKDKEFKELRDIVAGNGATEAYAKELTSKVILWFENSTAYDDALMEARQAGYYNGASDYA